MSGAFDRGYPIFDVSRLWTREIATELAEIFMERGFVNEILMNNGTVFHSECLTQFFSAWNFNIFLERLTEPAEMVS